MSVGLAGAAVLLGLAVPASGQWTATPLHPAGAEGSAGLAV